jgi:two-component system, chemotaxis family, sensor histidine kinase and response regulator PixL
VVRMPSPRVVLVVDDEIEVRRLFSQVLEAGGFRSVAAPTAEHAWSLLEDGLSPAAVLLDLRMPGVGGLGFLLQLRADPRYAWLPVTIVTGESFIDHTTRSAVAALSASVSYKPLEIEEILTLAHQMVDSPQASAPR